MSDVGFVFDTSVGEVNLDLRQVIVPDMLARGWVHLPNLETDAELKTFARRVRKTHNTPYVCRLIAQQLFYRCLRSK